MREMLSFFGELIVTAAVAGLFYSLAPEGSQKRYIHFAISLAVLVALIGPMLSVVSELPELLRDTEFEVEKKGDVMENDLTNAVISASQKNIEDAITSLVSERFKLERDALRTAVTLDTSDTANIKILSVTVWVSESSAVLRQKIRLYLEEQLMDHAKIIIKE